MRAIGRIGRIRLPLEIDAEGRAKAVRSGAAPVSGPQRLSERVGTTKPETSTVVPPGVAPSSSPDAYDSKLEESRARYLGMLQLAKDIKRIVYHPFTIHLAPKRKYTPDFLIEWADGRIQVEEVKGSLKQKNARDSITRLHVAAAHLPMFTWTLTQRIKGEWEERCIPTS